MSAMTGGRARSPPSLRTLPGSVHAQQPNSAPMRFLRYLDSLPSRRLQLAHEHHDSFAKRLSPCSCGRRQLAADGRPAAGAFPGACMRNRGPGTLQGPVDAGTCGRRMGGSARANMPQGREASASLSNQREFRLGVGDSGGCVGPRHGRHLAARSQRRHHSPGAKYSGRCTLRLPAGCVDAIPCHTPAEEFRELSIDDGLVHGVAPWTMVGRLGDTQASLGLLKGWAPPCEAASSQWDVVVEKSPSMNAVDGKDPRSDSTICLQARRVGLPGNARF